MLKIRKFTCENLEKGCVTDVKLPHFSFSTESDRPKAKLKEAKLSIGDWSKETEAQVGICYGGPALKPFTEYEAVLQVVDEAGERAEKHLSFETGRMDTPWQGKWISDGEYHFTEKKVSPVPMVFQKRFSLKKPVKQARIYATAMGIYEISVNGKKAGEEYFAPGFTSYQTRLQYQTYDVGALLQEGKENELLVTVAGGWAVGSFVFTRKNRVSADRQALLLELRVVYEDGSSEVLGTDESWRVTEKGPVREADFYDGEVYDATVDIEKADFRNAVEEKLKSKPTLFAAEGVPVKAHERMLPVGSHQTKEGIVYDFGQNFAGVIELTLEAKAGQVVTVHHAEILKPDSTLHTEFLRTAKARVVYTCKEGKQSYSPKFTYMGFRYVCVEGIEADKVEVSARALYSDVKTNGSFRCSDERLNRLQENILWSSRSNFMDIPTDCPQRDERMGWTGDIAVFAPTACYNFDMSRFLEKWLKDMKAEQLPTGGIPNTIPAQGYGFPATMPVMAVDFWGDACVLVPWAEYRARGDVKVLEENYEMMKKYVDACKFWAGLLSVGKHRFLWNTLSVLHFGDWVAPDVPKMSQWQKRSKWTATASLAHTSGLLSKIAHILGKEADAEKYSVLSEKTADAYCSLLSDGQGRMKEEFQTAYVLPLYFGMFPEKVRKAAADHLAELAEKNNYRIGTGFPGTPYILFALADNGREDTAFRMLFNEQCPSWLYEVKMGATTIWERWDGLDETGNCPIGNDGTDLMISYNHYASGAVGDFLYRRIAGIEMISPGYKQFLVKPLVPEELKKAEGSVDTPYGEIKIFWEKRKEKTEEVFFISVTVPMGTVCELVLPDGTRESLESGNYERSCRCEKH